ncbi:tripartite tricarboxylate transporter substrate binding protein [Thalassobacillus devorans]|uniref:tripartite tricarboxylate transporter substrate binding protein n=1 Tax=Thalassobacillus devorans TaxID=279813 RepID=UPI000A1CC164|nr:tripartite tricarboxylate transporter substrate binding protein [Thalassobacillus devorans]
MKKVTSVLLTILFLFSILLVGCNAKESSLSKNNENSQSKDEEGKLNTSFSGEEITFLIPNGPGGANDLSVRGLIPEMESELGAEIIPKNQPASKGIVAAVDVSRSKPNGQTLYFNSQTLILLSLQEKSIDLSKIQPLAQVVEDTSAISVPKDSPYNTLEELVEAAKKNPGKLKIATNGKGALWDFSAKTFAKEAGIELQYIPYSSGGSEMSKAVAAGEVDISANSPSEVKPLVDAGKIKVLAVQSDERHSLLPDVPTTTEAGVESVFPVWRGVFTVKETDEVVLDQLEQSIKQSWERKKFKEFLDNKGMNGKFRGHKEFTEFFNNQVEMYKELVE